MAHAMLDTKIPRECPNTFMGQPILNTNNHSSRFANNKLANGLFVQYDSMSFLNKERENTIQRELRHAKDVDYFTLNDPPDFIHVISDQ